MTKEKLYNSFTKEEIEREIKIYLHRLEEDKEEIEILIKLLKEFNNKNG